ncbi:hypothetical protein M3Y94_00973600 [Aphelenchoides besseyi]|nr:hypothetical protein M3Y94_00973600 [Aphelenchoides besseyi]KAI6224593.1 hypothetical protein M3Y95_00769300 [Aphelenchoides besseyi]
MHVLTFLILLLLVPSVLGKTVKYAHLETVGNVIFKEETVENCMTVKWDFHALNKTILKMGEWPKDAETQSRIDELIDQANNRILTSINHRLPGIKHRFKRSVGSNVDFETGWFSFAGLASMFGNPVDSKFSKLSKEEKLMHEPKSLEQIQMKLEIMVDNSIRLYREQLDSILLPAQHFHLLNEERVAETANAFVGSGRVVDIKVPSFAQAPRSLGMLSQLSATVCFLSTATEFPLYKAHAGGQFSASRQTYLRMKIAPFWVQKRDTWYMVDCEQCSTKAAFNATICPLRAVQTAFNCNPSTYYGCNIDAVSVTSPFVIAEPLSNAWYIVTTAKVYNIEYANKTIRSHDVGASGTFYVSAPADSVIVVGTRRLPGSGEIHSAIYREELFEFQGDDSEWIEKGVEYQAIGHHEKLALQKITYSSKLFTWLSNHQLGVFIFTFFLMVTFIISTVIVLRRYYGVLRSKTNFWTPGDY